MTSSSPVYKFKITVLPTWDDLFHRFFVYSTDEDQAIADFRKLTHSDRFADAEILAVRNVTLYPPVTRNMK